MRWRKDKAPAAGPSPKLKSVPGSPPAPVPKPGGAASDQAIDIPSGLTKAFRVTAGGTDAVMAVVMVRGEIPELLEAYDHYEQSVDERGGPDGTDARSAGAEAVSGARHADHRQPADASAGAHAAGTAAAESQQLATR